MSQEVDLRFLGRHLSFELDRASEPGDPLVKVQQAMASRDGSSNRKAP